MGLGDFKDSHQFHYFMYEISSTKVRKEKKGGDLARKVSGSRWNTYVKKEHVNSLKCPFSRYNILSLSQDL